jgi:hypothetical protein
VLFLDCLQLVRAILAPHGLTLRQQGIVREFSPLMHATNTSNIFAEIMRPLGLLCI